MPAWDGVQFRFATALLWVVKSFRSIAALTANQIRIREFVVHVYARVRAHCYPLVLKIASHVSGPTTESGLLPIHNPWWLVMNAFTALAVPLPKYGPAPFL